MASVLCEFSFPVSVPMPIYIHFSIQYSVEQCTIQNGDLIIMWHWWLSAFAGDGWLGRYS